MEVDKNADLIGEDSSEESECENEETDEEAQSKKVYLPGEKLSDGEELVCDYSAYKMYHQAQTGAPCLSFDVIADSLGDKREDFPLTCYVVAGTQAERAHTNNIIVLKMSNLHPVKEKPKENNEEDDSESEDSDTDDEEEPELESAMIQHIGAVNRVRSTRINDTHLAASWSETGKVYIWNLEKPLQAVDDAEFMSAYVRNQENVLPLFSFDGHQYEGFAIDWCQTTSGRLATGDTCKNIHIWNPKEGGIWHIDQRPYSGHTASVEDIQWSPNEQHVFASCSVDKSIRVWDARAAPNKACMLSANEAHDRDVNVIHWNKNEPFIVSGGDDGMIKVWDLRQFNKSTPVAVFKHHTAPVTSVQWHPTESSVFAASGSDDQITLWDLAVEKDMETDEECEVPPQLLFIHQGQTDIKELSWHKQLPGVIISTAHSGFNIFRTISV